VDCGKVTRRKKKDPLTETFLRLKFGGALDALTVKKQISDEKRI
jgi:hypothetical protein